MSRCRISTVYEYFDEHENDFNCKVEIETSGNVEICGKKIFKLNDGASTSNLKRHLKRNPTEYDVVEKVDLTSKKKAKKTDKTQPFVQ